MDFAELHENIIPKIPGNSTPKTRQQLSIIFSYPFDISFYLYYPGPGVGKVSLLELEQNESDGRSKKTHGGKPEQVL
jgi:hypothetical protein